MNWFENPPSPDYTYQPERVLFCNTCQCWTKHVLTKSRDFYVCGCSTQIKYMVNNAPVTEGVK